MIKNLSRMIGQGCFAVALLGAAFAEDPLRTNTNNFQIPFAVDDAGPGPIAGSAVLFASVDGRPMERIQTVDASTGMFNFRAGSDGLYAFAVRMIDSTGKAIGNDSSPQPEMSVIVDTLAPELSFRLAETAPGEINLQWACSENEVAPGSLRLEYAEGTDGRWKQIIASPGATGQSTINAQPGTAVSVRGFIADLAGNQGTGSSQIVLSTRTVQNKSQQQDNALTGGNTQPGGNPLVIPENNPVGPSPFPGPQMNAGLPNPPVVNNDVNVAAAPGIQFPTQPYVANSPGPMNGYVAPAPPLSPNQNQFNGGQFPGGQVNGGQFAGNQSGNQFGSHQFGNPSPTYSNIAPTATQPGMQGTSRQLVNQQVFNIDYQVEDVGPSGVSAVELFVTENNGREWFRYGNDVDLQTPFKVDTRGEGTFGFAVRVRNGIGFSGTPPQPGELPTIVVTVDQTPPTAELGRPQVVINGGGRVRLAWRVSDQNSAATPVRLEYAVSASGPWTPLFDWQVDHGGYEMPIQSGMPSSLHFRLLARDAAGNVTATQTNQPVLIDQKRPIARLLRVQPVSMARGL